MHCYEKMHKRISIACPVFNGNEKKYLMECVDTAWVSAKGRFINEFEEKFADYCNVKYALSCSNGTVSLHLIMVALGLKPGDEVIMPTLTYIATANAVRYCGATPVFVDSNEKTFNMDADKIEEKINKKTKAVLPVHLYGLPAEMDKIRQISDKYGLSVIEDAAEAHGAVYKGKRSGALGDVASFSFFGNKVITCGEGGMVVTNDKELYERMKLLKGQAVDPNKNYWHLDVGYNYRMTNMQAALGLAQLENIDWHLEQRARVTSLYREELKDMREYFTMQEIPEYCISANWMNNIVLNENVLMTRDEVMSRMEQYNIEMRPVFYPMHIMPPYYSNEPDLGIAEKIASRGISLPSHALLTKEDVKYVCNCLKSIIAE